MLRSICVSLLGLLCWVSATQAQVTFESKFPEGAKSHSTTESKTAQTLTLNGINIDTSSSTFILSKTSIGSRAANGNILIQTKVESIQSDISLGNGISIQFDSANPDKKAPLPQLEPVLDGLRAAAKVTLNIERDAKNKLVSVKLPEGEFEKLPESVKDRFDEDSLRKSIEQAVMMLPDDPVKIGDSWERSKEVKIGGGQTMTFRTNYKYAGPIEKDGAKLEKITGKTVDVNYRVDGNAAIQVTKSDFKVAESEITVLFNPALGAIISAESKTQVVGPITLVVNNMELDGKVDLTIEEKTLLQK